jgi:hypothetical protein
MLTGFCEQGNKPAGSIKCGKFRLAKCTVSFSYSLGNFKHRCGGRAKVEGPWAAAHLPTVLFCPGSQYKYATLLLFPELA